ncbi:MAG: peptide deformylase [Pseudomonadota bacterium]
MAIRDILILPDKRLREVSEPVQEITDELRTLVADMYDTMYDAPGIGLAAIQIGVPLRIVVTDCSAREDEREPLTLLNPEILNLSGDPVPYEEGCLSIPDYYEEVERPPLAKVRYMDMEGQTHEIDADGLLSTCIQHEVDHLDGKLFIDYLSSFKRSRVMTKFKKAARLREKATVSA